MIGNERLLISRFLVIGVIVVGLCSDRIQAQKEKVQETKSSVLGKLKSEAEKLGPLVRTTAARDFLAQVKHLPKIKTRVVYYDKESRQAISMIEYIKLSDQDRKAKFKKLELDEKYYYTTRYGSPLAFVRPLEIAGKAGLKDLNNKRVADFGFGTIGHLRLMACCGADVTGIEVDPILPHLYSSHSGGTRQDVGEIKTGDRVGKISLQFGSFPSDEELTKRIPDDLDLFVSKNTLKRGYIHPEKPAPKRMLIDLKVSDQQYCEHIFKRLKPGGMFLIYNLHPAPAAEGKPYIPWADGRCPFSKDVLKKVGFEVLEFDQDDTEAALKMAETLGWGKPEALKKNLFSTFTLLKKPK